MTFSLAFGTTPVAGYPGWVRTLSESERRMLPHTRRRNLASLRRQLVQVLAKDLDRPIRHVVAYEERVVDLGGCSTCEYLTTVFLVTFKDQSGRTLLWEYTGPFQDLLKRITAPPETTV
jgi:hypothetical protein